MQLLSRRNFLGIVGGFIFSVICNRFNLKSLYALEANVKNNSEKPKKVHGVVVLRSDDIISWDGTAHPYVDYINQEAVDELINKGIGQLTGAKDTRTAWKNIINYKKGERIVIKPNFNWINTGFKKIVTSPQVINTIIKGLVENAGVNEKDICIYDVSRPLPSFYKEKIEFNVRFVHRPVTLYEIGLRKLFGDLTSPSNIEIETTSPVIEENGKLLKCYLPRVVAMADHLINIPLLKAHQFLLFSGALKNHFGSIVFSDKSTSPRPFHGEHIHDFIVDVNMNRHLRKITRLVICDAIVGTWSDENLGAPEKWKTFDGDYPSSLFFSKDPFTMDVYLRDLVKKEREKRGLAIKPDTFLDKFEIRNTKS